MLADFTIWISLVNQIRNHKEIKVEITYLYMLKL